MSPFGRVSCLPYVLVFTRTTMAEEEKLELQVDTDALELGEDAAAGTLAQAKADQAVPDLSRPDAGDLEKQGIRGVFSTQAIEKVGTGTTTRKTIRKTFWMCEEQSNETIHIQPLNVNCVPSGAKKTIPKEEFLNKFSPEPEFYHHSVFPAIKKLNHAIELGESHRNKGKTFSAEFEYQNALNIDLDNVRANFGLGLTYLSRGETKKADNIFERLVNLDATFEPEHKHLFNDFGINLRKNKMYNQAVDYYTRALDLSQGDENLHYNIARAYLSKNELELAVQHLQTALKMNPELDAAVQFHDWLKTKGVLNEEGQLNPDASLLPEDNGGAGVNGNDSDAVKLNT